MNQATYFKQRDRIEHYFDRTAAQAWARLTSNAPVSGIRATVRAGRDRMRATMLSWLPRELRGQRLLDAGCGTGLFAVEAARRGASVLAVDLSPTLVDLAQERLPRDLGLGDIEFRAGDMLEPQLGQFDYVIAMDSLIHYEPQDVVRVLAEFAVRTRKAVVFTFAPKNFFLSLMISVGRLFPRRDRAPFIVPVAEATLRRLITRDPVLGGMQIVRTEKISKGFYISQAMEIRWP